MIYFIKYKLRFYIIFCVGFHPYSDLPDFQTGFSKPFQSDFGCVMQGFCYSQQDISLYVGWSIGYLCIYITHPMHQYDVLTMVAMHNTKGFNVLSYSNFATTISSVKDAQQVRFDPTNPKILCAKPAKPKAQLGWSWKPSLLRSSGAFEYG